MSETQSGGVRPLRAAFVGLRHGHTGTLNPAAPGGLLGTFRQVPDAAIVALCEDTDGSRLARERGYAAGAEVFESVDDLVAWGEFDFAVVALPAVEVPPAAVKLVRAGKHCLLEKTVARRADDFAPVVEAARASGAHVLVHFPWRHHPAVRAMRRLLDAGTLGRPAAIAMQMVTSQVGPLPGQRNPAGMGQREATEGGGMLHFLGGHFLEAMCYLFGDVRAVTAMCAPVVGNMEPLPAMDDVSSVSLQFTSGAVGTIHTGYLNAVTDANRDFIQIWGTDGMAYWPGLGPKLTATSRVPEWSAAPTQTYEFGPRPRSGVYGGSEWLFELSARFVHGIRDGTPPEVGPAEALRVLRITDAAYEASRTRRWVEIDP